MYRISSQINLSAQEQVDGVTNDNPRIGWHNVVTAANLSSSSSDADWPVLNLANPITYLFWQGTDLGAHRLRVAAPGLVNYVAIAGHNLSGGTVTPQKSTDGSSWTSIDAGVTLTDNEPFIYEFPDTTANHFGLLLDPLAEVPVVSVFYTGQILRLQRRLYVGHKPMPLNRETNVSTGRSESGQFLGRVKRSQTLQGEAALTNLTSAWYRANLDPFAQAAETLPFFWAWRPGTYPEETALAWLTDDLHPQNARSNGMLDVTLNMRGIGALAHASADVS